MKATLTANLAADDALGHDRVEKAFKTRELARCFDATCRRNLAP